ncbi:CbtA family protein [Actinomadura algeriensis]|uniref:Cobalt transporter CbtA n=1 Tax=Actinomadura algeriensis TaxID=1679523 RepID=A0ABR9JWB2_9ACTN|nr:CbtA family protein [Actinomadura algeriensis]MBE1534661.1 putative cobalt transporter CbtA [Actinomadura algeriensis]
MMRTLLVRGMLAGLAAAALALLVAWLYGEPRIADAIAFEEAAAHAAGDHAHGEEVVSRTAQQTVGLVTAVGVYGIAVGGLFAIAFAFAQGRLGALGARSTAAVVALAGFVALVLVPFLKYPATPPAVGAPETIGSRTVLYFGMAALGVLATAAAVIVGRRLVPRLGAWNATIVTAAGFVVLVAAANRLTPDPDALPEGFPATVLWDFRIASLGVQFALWTTLGVVFGLLSERALARRARPVSA